MQRTPLLPHAPRARGHLRHLTVCVLPLLVAACGKDKQGDGDGTDGTTGTTGGTTGVTEEVFDLALASEILGVPNIDDDDENGDHDWADAEAGDEETVPFGLDADALSELDDGAVMRVELEGDLDLVRVWHDGSILLDEDDTSAEFSAGDDLSSLAAEFAMPRALAQVTFTLVDADGADVDTWQTTLEAAPLILNHHLQPAEWVNAVDTGGGRYGNQAFITGFDAVLGADFGTVPGTQVDWDVWMQDEIEFGTFTAPGYELDFVIDSIRSGRDQYLDSYPEDHLFGPDMGTWTWGSGGATSQDSFGNLEVSPPVTVDGVEYPFGRIYYGDSGRYSMTDDMKDMLDAQEVQAPFTLDIGWLCVGHVDEFITMLPDPDAPKGFRVWVADIDEGRSFLEGLPSDLYMPKYDDDHHHATPAELLSNASLWSYNRDLMDEHIEPNIDVLKSELGLDESDFVRVPGIFERSSACGNTALALIPATVNMQVYTGEDGVEADLFIPDPFMRADSAGTSDDPFVAMFEALLPANLTAHWLDDWNSYHMAWGEVHCGSNTIRTPAAAEWWTDARHLMED